METELKLLETRIFGVFLKQPNKGGCANDKDAYVRRVFITMRPHVCRNMFHLLLFL